MRCAIKKQMITPLPNKSGRRNTFAELWIASATSSRLKIPRVAVHHPVLSGNRDFLRDLRAAEMAAWEAGLSLKAYQRATKLLQQVSQ